MVYVVGCSIDGCPFSSTTLDSIDDVLDLQEAHTEEYGMHHNLEFERVEAAAMADDDDD